MFLAHFRVEADEELGVPIPFMWSPYKRLGKSILLV